MSDRLLSPEMVCEMLPGMTKQTLANLRFQGAGPSYMKPSPKKVLYAEADVLAWLETTKRTSTQEVA